MPHGLRPQRQPVRRWNEAWQINYRTLFTHLAKAALDAGQAAFGRMDKLPDTLEHLMDASGALEREPKPVEHWAWLLIQRALMRAVATLLEENRRRLYIPEGHPPPIEALSEHLEVALNTMEVTVDEAFFRNPKTFVLVTGLRAPLAEWLHGLGMMEAEALNVAARVPSYFVQGLDAEWRAHPTWYEPIRQALDTPFTRASRREQTWRTYAAELDRALDEPLLDESFGLRDVYVPLRAWYSTEPPDRSHDASRSRRNEVRHVVDVHDALEAWLQDAGPYDALRVVKGGPGSGKSSLTRMLAATVATQGETWRVLRVPLHQLELTGDLAKALHTYVKDYTPLEHNPLDREEGEERLLLLLDGLDELAIQGKGMQELTRALVDQVVRYLDRINGRPQRRLLVVLTGRNLAVEVNETVFDKPEQVLTLLPYAGINTDEYDYHDPNGLLQGDAGDQRHRWWQNYGKMVGTAYENMPEAVTRSELKEVTAQPILNYLVALSYRAAECGEPGALDFSQAVTRNAIYRDLIERVYMRSWEKHPFPTKRAIVKSDFFRLLEYVAQATWHGDGRSTTAQAVYDLCPRRDRETLAQLAASAEAGVIRLLTAFYFRRKGSSAEGHATFEFTHKSFGEYLVACRIVHVMGRLYREIHAEYYDPEQEPSEASLLKTWAKVCAPQPISFEVWQFVRDEVAFRVADSKQYAGITRETVRGWRDMLVDLIEYVLRRSMPMEQVGVDTYHQMWTQAQNAEEALLVTLYACNTLLREVVSIQWPGPNAALQWMQRLEMGVSKEVAWRSYAYLRYDRNHFNGAFLNQANLVAASFEEAYLDRAQLSGANLQRANLREANLDYASLISANLCDANLDNATLYKTDLLAANLTRASLYEANLAQSNLERAHLVEANLYRANLREAGLYEADLRKANLFHIQDYAAIDLRRVKVDKMTQMDDVLWTIYREQNGLAADGSEDFSLYEEA